MFLALAAKQEKRFNDMIERMESRMPGTAQNLKWLKDKNLARRIGGRSMTPLKKNYGRLHKRPTSPFTTSPGKMKPNVHRPRRPTSPFTTSPVKLKPNVHRPSITGADGPATNSAKAYIDDDIPLSKLYPQKKKRIIDDDDIPLSKLYPQKKKRIIDDDDIPLGKLYPQKKKRKCVLVKEHKRKGKTIAAFRSPRGCT